HDDVRAGMAGNSTANQQQTAFHVDADDVEVLNGTLDVAQMTGHLLARENTTRILRLADGTRHAVRARVTVRGALRSEVVTLDGTGKALTDGDASDVYLRASFEDGFHGEDCTGSELCSTLGSQAEFLQYATGFDTSLGIVTDLSLADTRG